MIENLLDEVLMIISSYTGTPKDEIGFDSQIGTEIGINGGDSIEFLDELETKFGIDLSPLVEKHKKSNKIGLLRRILKTKPSYSSDFTVRQLVQFLSAHRS